MSFFLPKRFLWLEKEPKLNGNKEAEKSLLKTEEELDELKGSVESSTEKKEIFIEKAKKTKEDAFEEEARRKRLEREKKEQESNLKT